MTKPALFLDFDGVINFVGSMEGYRRTSGALGYVRTATLFVGDVGVEVCWSAELVYKLNEAKRRTGFEWLWLSTWRAWAVAEVDPALGTRSDGYVPWDSGDDAVSAIEDIVATRAARKYEALLSELRSRPRPFVWVDDDATQKHREVDFVADFDVPHLVLTPRAEVGMLRSDLDALTEFMKTHQA